MRFLSLLLIALCCSGCAVDRSAGYSGHQISEKNAPITVVVVSGEHDVAPKFISGDAPIYPARLLDRNVQTGSAHVRFTITKAGRVTAMRVVEATHPQFASGVAHAATSWRFNPAKKGAAPVEVVVETKVNFSMVGS